MLPLLLLAQNLLLLTVNKELATTFQTTLLAWHSGHHRPLPWKGISNPYLIWLSEIILQQTRVEQGLPYYEKFKAAFPTIQDMAEAEEDKVMKLWEGLGYYSRARNMHATAKYIAFELGGVFPSTYEDIRALKGVGPYTAAAIASFAYQLPHAVVDGNVYRVLARYFGIAEPVDTTTGKKLFAELAQSLLDGNQPGKYNQAIMDFGANCCTPKLPQCNNCPFQTHCKAFNQDSIAIFPVKLKKIKKRTRYFNFLILQQGEQVLINKRLEKDIWQNLYEFPLIETASGDLDFKTLLDNSDWGKLINGTTYELTSKSKSYKQQLTHQLIYATFWEIKLSEPWDLASFSNLIEVERKNLENFAFPKVIDWYLRDNSLFLVLL